ncbi:hypothetical protein OHR68_43195 [Spirillospora sp. NBC_00431]
MDGQDRRPLPVEPLECRQHAEELLAEERPWSSAIWALLAIAGELAAIRRQLEKSARKAGR